MSKQAISVTLAADNLLWVRGQAHARGAGSVSSVIDRLISAARAGGHVHDDSIRSVKGTVHIAETDPALHGADAAIGALFPGALVSEASARYRRSAKSSPRSKPSGRKR
ncbi:MAG: hypothetical protein HY699_22485 [Deltaproteobacteria bacterium]|nr:hypothetical protein [Deltaproteobacteria bacterium]